ncbi:MAG: DUF4838 domain-containing protein [Saprospiraceae bacterium]|nr:DUF4838 domain-containing protein [Saprospiraceae bacterium]
MKKILFVLFALGYLISCKQPSHDLIISQNKTSTYRIIYGEKASDSLVKAVTDFKNHLNIITGAELQAFADIVGPQPNEILIGKSNRTTKYDNSIPYNELGSAGYFAGARGDKWIITANNPTALTHALYDQLTRMGSVKVVETMTQYSQKNPLVIPADQDLVFKPTFSYRQVISTFANNADYRAWNRINIDNLKDWGTWEYSMERIFPSESYFKTHPEYYAQIGSSKVPDQINFLSPDLKQALDKNLEVWTMTKGRADYWSVSPYENNIVSEDKLTQDAIKETGSAGGALLKLVNEVADKHHERIHAMWVNGPYRQAPTNITPAGNVMVVLDTKDTDHGSSLGEGPKNEQFRTDLAGWKKLTSNIVAMIHVTNEQNFMMPFPNLTAMQQSFQYLESQGVKGVIITGSSQRGTALTDLKFYVASNLAYNAHQNLDSLIWQYCDNTYAQGAKSMLGYVQALEKAYQGSKSPLPMDASPAEAYRSWLAPTNINQLYSYFNSVINAAQNNSDLKEKVDRDRLSLIYAQLQVAKSMGTRTFGYFMNIGALSQLIKADQPNVVAKSETELSNRRPEWGPIQGMKDLVNQFVTDCDRMGIRVIDRDGTTPADFRDQILQYISQKVQTHLGFKQGTFSFNASPDPEFGDGDAAMLNDGVIGLPEDPRSNWVSLSGGEGEVTWDKGKDTLMSSVEVRFLQNKAARAWLPTQASLLISVDGQNFKEVKKISIPGTSAASQVYAANFNFGRQSVRSIKVKTVGRAVCPTDHKLSGSPAVILIDEVVIK